MNAWVGWGVPLTPHYFLGKSHGSVSSPRDPSPSAGLPEEDPTAAPRSGSHDLEAVSYLEGLTTSLCGSCNEDPGSDPGSSPDSATPDDTSNSSSVVSQEREMGGQEWLTPPSAALNLQARAKPHTREFGEVLWTISWHLGPPRRTPRGWGFLHRLAQGGWGLAVKRR